MVDTYKDSGTNWIKSSRPPAEKPVACPKCGSKQIVSCPGGSSLKAVPGIWWSCQDCHHEW